MTLTIPMSEQTFEILLGPSLQYVRKLVRKRMRNADEAEDLLQQALLRAYVCRHQLREHSKFKSWLSSIAVNEVRMFQRAARPNVQLDRIADVEFRDHAPSPHAVCEQIEAAERVRAAMERLTQRDRTAIRLVDLNGLSLIEAAGKMEVSTAAFKSTHYRARQRLGQALRGMEAESLPIAA